MFFTTRYFFPHGIEGESMNTTFKQWDNLENAIDYCHRYAKGIRFAGVSLEDENGNLIYEISDNGIITDNRKKQGF